MRRARANIASVATLAGPPANAAVFSLNTNIDDMFARFAYVEDRDDAATDVAADDAPTAAVDNDAEEHPAEAAPAAEAPVIAAKNSSFFENEPAQLPVDEDALEPPPDTPADDAPAADTPADAPAAAPPAKRHKPLPLMDAGERDGPGTIGHETRPEVLINTWQSMAAGAASPANRRFIIVCGVILSSQTLTGTACKAIKALRDAARADGADDLDPAWLSAKEGVADVISMVNFRNNKAKFLVALATNVKRCRGRVAESTEGYLGYKGVGKELAGLLKIVNTAPLAEEWCLKEQSSPDC